MTMVSSGPISLGGNATTGGLNQSINIELGKSATATISLNDSDVRALLGVPSGAISLNNAYGKSNQFAFTISSNQTNANLRTLAVNAGWNQTSKVVATINGGIYVSSNSTGTPALTVNGSFPGGVELINNGFIVGMGGAGGNGGGNNPSNGQPGGGGGLALSASTAITINNASGTIAGGGGGGGGGAFVGDYSGPCDVLPYGGGGGGGGRSSNAANSAGGGGGQTFGVYSGNPGSSGTLGGAGGGGNGSNANGQGGRTAAGGSGGGWGSGGASGFYRATNWPILAANGAGGAGGAAVSGNSNITWIATGTRLGGIS